MRWSKNWIWVKTAPFGYQVSRPVLSSAPPYSEPEYTPAGFDTLPLVHEIIAIIFDFDDTLAPDSTSGYLERCGLDASRFWKEEVRPMMETRTASEEWDPVPAYLYRMIEKSNTGEIEPITRDSLTRWGGELPLYPGVETIFARLREVAVEVNPRVTLEFYLISSGIGEVLRNTPIACEFQQIWASDFAYDAQGRIKFPRKIVSFTDKTRYIFHVQKGIFGPEYVGKPFEVNRKVDPARIRVPIKHMIMVGDGYTDIPCFSLVKQGEGFALGVLGDPDNREKRSRAWGFIEDGRVSNLARANYSENSTLTHSLIMAVENLAKRIFLDSHIYQG